VQIDRAHVTFFLPNPRVTRIPLHVLFCDCVNILRVVHATIDIYALEDLGHWRSPPQRKPKTSLQICMGGVYKSHTSRLLSVREYSENGVFRITTNEPSPLLSEVKYEMSLQCVARRKSNHSKKLFVRKLCSTVIYRKMLF